jgi:hypothetical protein
MRGDFRCYAVLDTANTFYLFSNARVCGPTTPTCASPWTFWKTLTTFCVAGPKYGIISTSTGKKPRSLSFCCNANTSAPLEPRISVCTNCDVICPLVRVFISPFWYVSDAAGNTVMAFHEKPSLVKSSAVCIHRFFPASRTYTLGLPSNLTSAPVTVAEGSELGVGDGDGAGVGETDGVGVTTGCIGKAVPSPELTTAAASVCALTMEL